MGESGGEGEICLACDSKVLMQVVVVVVGVAAEGLDLDRTIRK